MREILFFVSMMAFWAVTSHVNAATSECVVAVSKDKFVASFPPVENSPQLWTWNAKTIKEDELDFSWTVEPGTVHKGNLKTSEYAFGLGHRSGAPHKPQEQGKLEELINLIKNDASVYLNSPDPAKRAAQDKLIGHIKIDVAIKNNNVMLFSRAPSVVSTIFGARPTHARLIFKSPDKDKSYSCIAEIDYQ